MSLPARFRSPRRLLLATAAAGCALAAFALLPQRSAEAQGVMSAPACQCSAPTPIPGIRSTVVHCMCGAMSCAITEYQPGVGASPGTQQMQCTR